MRVNDSMYTFPPYRILREVHSDHRALYCGIIVPFDVSIGLHKVSCFGRWGHPKLPSYLFP